MLMSSLRPATSARKVVGHGLGSMLKGSSHSFCCSYSARAHVASTREFCRRSAYVNPVISLIIFHVHVLTSAYKNIGKTVRWCISWQVDWPLRSVRSSSQAKVSVTAMATWRRNRHRKIQTPLVWDLQPFLASLYLRAKYSRGM